MTLNENWEVFLRFSLGKEFGGRRRSPVFLNNDSKKIVASIVRRLSGCKQYAEANYLIYTYFGVQ